MQPTESYPRGFLDGPSLPADGWGRPYVYAVDEGGAGYRLRSVGADGVDQGGEGDDVRAR